MLEVSIDIEPGGDPNSLMCYNEEEIIAVAFVLQPPPAGHSPPDHLFQFWSQDSCKRSDAIWPTT